MPNRKPPASMTTILIEFRSGCLPRPAIGTILSRCSASSWSLTTVLPETPVARSDRIDRKKQTGWPQCFPRPAGLFVIRGAAAGFLASAAALNQPPQAGAGDPALVPDFLVLAFFFGDASWPTSWWSSSSETSSRGLFGGLLFRCHLVWLLPYERPFTLDRPSPGGATNRGETTLQGIVPGICDRVKANQRKNGASLECRLDDRLGCGWSRRITTRT